MTRGQVKKILPEITDEQLKSIVKRFFEAIKSFLKKISGLDRAERERLAQREYGATVAELERAVELWEASAKATQERAEKQDGQKGNKAEVKAQFSLKKHNLLSKKEYARFNKQIGDIHRGEKYNISSDGLYIVPTGNVQGIENRLVYTNGNFHNPSIEKVVFIHSEDATEIAGYMEVLLYAEQTCDRSVVEYIEENEFTNTYTLQNISSFNRDSEKTDERRARQRNSEVDGNRSDEDGRGSSSNLRNDKVKQFSIKDSYAKPMYSQLERKLESYKGSKMAASSVIPYLKGRGVKNEEIKWTGLNVFLILTPDGLKFEVAKKNKNRHRKGWGSDLKRLSCHIRQFCFYRQ